MHVRFRAFAAFMALLALALYFAEGVWASMCPPDMQMAGMEEVHAHGASEQGAPGHSCSGGAHPASTANPELPEHPRSDEPTCPLGPIGPNGSCVAVSLPANTTSLLPSVLEGPLTSSDIHPAGDLLLVASLFHPPRA